MSIRHRRDLWKIITVSGNAVEIGVAEGYFSADMLSWPINFPIVYMVDRWLRSPNQKGDASNPQEWHQKNLAAARERVAKYEARAQFLRGDSVLMSGFVPDKSLALVYIDGDHSHDGVLRDIFAWVPKLVPGGVMAFHDYENHNYGVKTAVRDYCQPRHIEIHLLPEDKPEDAGAYFYVNPIQGTL